MADVHRDSVLVLRETYWYHVQDLPGIGTVGLPGDPEPGRAGEGWDFRPDGKTDAYLAGVSFKGKRVLEVGPASGFWTAELERRGADVLALEIDDAHAWDFVPNAAVDLEPMLPERAAIMTGVKKGWHLARAAHGLTRAEIVYGHAEQPPADRGRFDILMLGCVLLHTRSPFTILERCAALTDETVVIVERHFAALGDEPVCRLAASIENQIWGTWWDFTPAYFERALRLLGFSQVSVSFHEQIYRDLSLPLYTVVGRR
jgi:O-methyltransferase